ncbi:MAG: OmcA/MtrC family decaheme c-type cytochrome [Chromatiales bacterium]|nr:OmcA/MtrC family decaheme c-type cytochrome [Chromatiales bacterium]
MSRLSTISRKTAQLAAIGLTGLILVISGCGGSDGAQGPAGDTGQQGPAGADGIGAPIIDISNSSDLADLIEDGNRLVVEITAATIASPPVIHFTVTDSNGVPVIGIDGDATRYTLVKLVPGTGNRFGYWQSYINQFETADGGGEEVLEKALQATYESGSVDRFVDNGDGSYTYTYATDPMSVTDPVAVAYDPNLTHRVAMQFDGIDGAILPYNPSFDFVPSGAAIETRKIVATETCNGCHDALTIHGRRNEVDYCVTCHNPGSRDQDTGALVEMSHLVHSIHGAQMRLELGATESCAANGGIAFSDHGHWFCTDTGDDTGVAIEFDADLYAYQVVGYRERLHNFNHVVFPQELLFCETCHTASTETPDGDMWLSNITAESCGGCHANLLVTDAPDPVTGLSTYGIQHNLGGSSFTARNGECTICHDGDNIPLGFEAHSAVAGSTRLRNELGENYQAEIVGADFVASPPTVDVKITNLTTGANDLFADAEYTAGRQTLYLGWSTDDFYNGDEDGNVSFPSSSRQGYSFQLRLSDVALAPTQNADGSFTIPLVDLPAAMSGDPMISFDARMDVDGERAYAESVVFFPGSERVLAVDEAKCNNCHKVISNHGGRGQNNLLVCLNCHNNELATTWDANGDGVADEIDSVSLAVAVHKHHNGDPSYRDGAAAEVHFPGFMGKCETCHVEGRYNGPRETARAITIGNGESTAVWTDDIANSPTAGICTNCHIDLAAVNHMKQNGAMFGAVKSIFTLNGVDGIPAYSQESCSVCHGPGSIADTAEQHQ